MRKFAIWLLFRVSKSSQTVLPKMFKGMDYFSSIAKGKVESQTLVYGGKDIQNRTRYQVRPWNEV
ncbi:hypothetical protein [Tunicatimonas pelagia]|uniref:hypothetical protein n=1 Tax=Tunicatimonas pelagia TaxID=931531 RepID=UPI002665E137|nr:hypothetical protein [Tunicatimonas pelagia]WKN41248.1 hypothetical protein P0M28_19615 [Tunicatimonas pelagia]